MAIQDRDSEKITAKAYAKLALIEHLESFELTESFGFDELKRTEPDKVQKFVDQLRDGMIKKLTPKPKAE